MCSPGCFDYWSRLLALAAARPDDVRFSRRGFLAASAVPFVAAACATAPAPSGPTRDLLDATLSFDLHSHPGLFKRTSNNTLAGHRQEAESGRVKLIALTATSDAPVIARDRNGALHSIREPKPGELYASMYRQIDALVRWSGAAGMPVVSSVTNAGAPGPPIEAADMPLQARISSSTTSRGRAYRLREYSMISFTSMAWPFMAKGNMVRAENGLEVTPETMSFR